MQVSYVHHSEISPTWTKSGKDDKANPVMPVWRGSHQIYRQIENFCSDSGSLHTSMYRRFVKEKRNPNSGSKRQHKSSLIRKATEVCSLWREAIFRWQVKQSVLSCTWSSSYQEYTQTKAYRTASVHSLGLRIPAEVGQQIINCHLEGYVKVQHCYCRQTFRDIGTAKVKKHLYARMHCQKNHFSLMK